MPKGAIQYLFLLALTYQQNFLYQYHSIFLISFNKISASVISIYYYCFIAYAIIQKITELLSYRIHCYSPYIKLICRLSILTSEFNKSFLSSKAHLKLHSFLGFIFLNLHVVSSENHISLKD